MMAMRNSPRNTTIPLTETEIDALEERLLVARSQLSQSEVIAKTILGDALEVIDYLPMRFADMLFVDPP